MFLRKLKGRIFLCALFLTGALGLKQASADPDLKFASYLKEVKWSGDYRLRFDNEHFREGTANVVAGNKATEDRGRFRMRLRLGTDFTLPDGFVVKTRLDSGTGEQVSPNQTFSNLDSEKAIWIGRAY